MNDDRTHYIYRAWDEHGVLLYIGCTKDPLQRSIAHRKSLWRPFAETIKLQGPFQRPVAFAREKAAIEAERPAFNCTPEYRRANHARWLREKALIAGFSTIAGCLDFEDIRRAREQAAAEFPVITAEDRLAAYLDLREQHLGGAA